MEKIIGILGGMGPEATADLFLKIIRNTPAQKDQDHIRIIVENNPKIPDRTGYILQKSKNPLPYLIKTAKNLERDGADFVLMPCNTAHYFYEEIVENINIPVINMIEETAIKVYQEKKSNSNICLLSTLGTIKSGIYDKWFK